MEDTNPTKAIEHKCRHVNFRYLKVDEFSKLAIITNHRNISGTL